MSITFNELIKGNSLADIPVAHQHNLEILLQKINVVRSAYGKPLTVTSGYRNLQKHKDIYRAKGVPESSIPLGSHHLTGCAVDIADPTGDFHKWCKANEDLLRALGLYLENRRGLWQHLSWKPFKSFREGGTIWFNP